MKFYLFLIILLISFVGCSKPSAEEMFNKGVDAQRAEQFNDAIDAYQELIDTYPDSVRSPEALYAIAVIYQNHKRSYNESIMTFRKFNEKYPNHPLSASASFLIGFIYNNELKKYDSARIAYQEFINKFPDNQLVVSAKFELDNLGKDPNELFKERTQTAQQEIKPAKKKK